MAAVEIGPSEKGMSARSSSEKSAVGQRRRTVTAHRRHAIAHRLLIVRFKEEEKRKRALAVQPVDPRQVSCPVEVCPVESTLAPRVSVFE